MNKKWLFTTTAVLAFLVITLTYIEHFDNAFHFDDVHTIQDNPYIQSVRNIPKFFVDSSTFSVLPQNQSYRPLLTTTFAVDYWLGGMSPFYFQLHSFMMFIALCIVMYFIFAKILNNRYFALFGSSFFALHTAMAETVNYISARSDIMSTLLVALSLLIYIYSTRTRKYFIYLIPAVLAVFAKETAMVFPLIFLVYMWLFEKEEKTVLWKRILPCVVVALLMGLLSYLMLSRTYYPSPYARWQYALIQPYAILHYFISFLFPLNLSADADWSVVKNIFDEKVIIGVVFLLGLFFVAFYTARKNVTRALSFGFFWFLIACFPTSSGIVPLSEVINDHRMFFPFIGLVICATWSLEKLYFNLSSSKLKLALISFMVALLLVHSFGTYKRNKVWHSEESLWYDVTVKSPKNGRGLMNYGITQMAKGDFTKAEYYFVTATSYAPHYSLLYVNLAILKQATGNSVAAEQNYLKAIGYGKNMYEPYCYYADFLRAFKRYKEQELNLKQCLLLSPSFIGARHSLMQLYAEQRRWNELEQLSVDTLRINAKDKLAEDLLTYIKKMKLLAEQLRTTLRYVKDKNAYVSLSALYYQLGEYKNSIDVANEVLKLYPGFSEAYKFMCLSYKAMGDDKNLPPQCKASK